MSSEFLVTQVQSHSSSVPGRSLNTARTNHFVIDEPAYAGGPGEAVTPAESFLAGISGCGVLLVESFARQDAIPLQRAHVFIEGVRRSSDPANFKKIDLRFELAGVDQQQAEQLVERFKER